MITILILLIALGLFYYKAIKPMSYWKQMGIKQTNPSWLFGDKAAFFFRKEGIVENFQRLYKTYPNSRYFGSYDFTYPTLIVRDPDLIKEITVKDFDHFTDHKNVLPSDIDPLWNRNLLSLKGQSWKEMRPVLSPAFTGNKMRIIFNLFNECAEGLLDFFTKQNKELIEVQMKDVATLFSNDAIATSAFGVKVNSFQETDNEFYRMGQQITNFTSIIQIIKINLAFVFHSISKITGVNVFEDPARQFFSDLIVNNVRMREEKGISRPDMIQLLVEAKRSVNEKKTHFQVTNTDILAQALIFFFAGFESVSSLITFMAYELALNPEIQDKLRTEIQETFKECDGKWTYDAIMKMKYLDMVESETLRKWPNFPSTDRVCTKDYVIEPKLPDEKPVLIKKGTIIDIPTIGLHYDPQYFPDPERFDPERFNDENKHNINPYAYMPFGAGPRICIGLRFALLEAKVFFAHLLLKFEIVPTKNTQIPVKLSKKTFNVYPEDKVNLGFKRL